MDTPYQYFLEDPYGYSSTEEPSTSTSTTEEPTTPTPPTTSECYKWWPDPSPPPPTPSFPNLTTVKVNSLPFKVEKPEELNPLNFQIFTTTTIEPTTTPIITTTTILEIEKIICEKGCKNLGF
jgi:hypothetical protein